LPQLLLPLPPPLLALAPVRRSSAGAQRRRSHNRWPVRRKCSFSDVCAAGVSWVQAVGLWRLPGRHWQLWAPRPLVRLAWALTLLLWVLLV